MSGKFLKVIRALSLTVALMALVTSIAPQVLAGDEEVLLTDEGAPPSQQAAAVSAQALWDQFLKAANDLRQRHDPVTPHELDQLQNQFDGIIEALMREIAHKSPQAPPLSRETLAYREASAGVQAALLFMTVLTTTLAGAAINISALQLTRSFSGYMYFINNFGTIPEIEVLDASLITLWLLSHLLLSSKPSQRGLRDKVWSELEEMARQSGIVSPRGSVGRTHFLKIAMGLGRVPLNTRMDILLEETLGPIVTGGAAINTITRSVFAAFKKKLRARNCHLALTLLSLPEKWTRTSEAP